MLGFPWHDSTDSHMWSIYFLDAQFFPEKVLTPNHLNRNHNNHNQVGWNPTGFFLVEHGSKYTIIEIKAQICSPLKAKNWDCKPKPSTTGSCLNGGVISDRFFVTFGDFFNFSVSKKLRSSGPPSSKLEVDPVRGIGFPVSLHPRIAGLCSRKRLVCTLRSTKSRLPGGPKEAIRRNISTTYYQPAWIQSYTLW